MVLMRHQTPGIRAVHIWLLALLLACPLLASPKKEKDRTPANQAEAEKWIADATKRMYKIVRLDNQYLLYTSWDGSVQYGIALARISAIRVGTHDNTLAVIWRDYSHDNDDYIQMYFNGRAESFAGALEYLARASRQQLQAKQDSAFQQFVMQAKAWRDAPQKPAMPEAAREHQVLAEYAFKQRETEKAIHEYNAAVEIFPTWPEGQFNLATLAGEQKDYDTAVLHMKEYLELMPDSPDAQAAKDSIIIWKDRLNIVFSAENNSQPQQPTKGSAFQRVGLGQSH
jgi:hypothetical protein